jgi:hypothetical protein
VIEGIERCENCRAYRQAMKPDRELTWVCKRHPPQVISIAAPTPQGVSVQIMAMYPGVEKDGYCCDWLPRVTS